MQLAFRGTNVNHKHIYKLQLSDVFYYPKCLSMSFTSTIDCRSEQELKDTSNNEPFGESSMNPTEASIIKEPAGNTQCTFICHCRERVESKSVTAIRKSRNMSVVRGNVPQTSPHSFQVTTVPNDTVVDTHLVDHDYEEINEAHIDNTDDTSLNIDNTLPESETDSKNGSSISPTEDNEGYLHPYHSLLHSAMEGNV
ncbi:unnamed protein product [Mytilus edulis]|uniref:Uncharacterized protein n=1 Tax=Mytilus edulis TaxID=6550 RepID=A0A8S3TVN1_MYTED|nr:unnamed protein product [Mytilus edulis]